MLIVRSQRVVTSDGIRPAAIHIDLKGVIRAVEPDNSPELSDSVVMPGLVDIHASFHEPEHADWEGFHHGTRAAAAGGFTTVVEMPGALSTLEDWSARLRAAQGKLWTDCGFWASPRDARESELLWRAGVLGFATQDHPELRQEMHTAHALNAPLVVGLNAQGAAPAGETYESVLAAYPPAEEASAVARIAEWSKETGARTHIACASSSAAVEGLRAARERRVPVSIATHPHHLFFHAGQVADGATAFLASPPIREQAEQDALWSALEAGAIDLISSGHAPLPREQKQGGFSTAMPGISGLQVALAAVWTARRPPIENLVRWMSEEPARLAGLGHRKGRIAPGYDADLVVWNPQKKWMLMPQDLHHRHKMSPYIGAQLQGEVEVVFLRGAQIYAYGEFDDSPIGRVLERGKL